MDSGGIHYAMAAPISVATKLNEDTVTYLNQGQAYEIKLENRTDLAEVKKGFMCSIINIGFHERHMQQAENELWQQWSHQNPNEKIFSVDMKLSYNVFGVESDGLNKYEFLWDSSKVAGVFIRINSISTEFTAKKHGGEKGIPFKLSIETFSYNSKTHESYFISAACCQIKVFKPKGAERKIRSDRDKILKRPLLEQEKYHKPCDHTIFRECSLASLHPMADGSLCFYRHSHGHFASKQNFVSASGAKSSSSDPSSAHNQTEDELDQSDNNPRENHQSPEDHQPTEEQQNHRPSQNNNNNNDNDVSANNISTPRQCSSVPPHSASRLMQQSTNYIKSSFEPVDHDDDANCGEGNHISSAPETSGTNYNHANELAQPSSFNHQMYHGNPAIRAVPNLPSISSSQHFGMSSYYSHPPIPSHIPPPPSYGITTPSSLPNFGRQNSHGTQTFPVTQQQHLSVKGVSSIYRQLTHDKPTVGLIAATAAAAAIQVSHSSSFKASDLSISSNFQTYLGTSHNQTENHHLHEDQPFQDIKDCSNHSFHQLFNHHQHHSHETYEPNTPHHSFHSTFSTNNNPPSNRQRSNSASFTSSEAGTEGPSDSTYSSPNRNIESYSGNNGNSASIENPMIANQWSHNHHSTAQASNMGPFNSRFGPTNSQATNNNSSINSHENNGYNGGLAYESINQHFESDQGSPNKANHNHANESSTNCFSRSKDTASTNQCQSPQHCYGSPSKSNSRMITASSDCNEVVAWFAANRFSGYSKTFNNFSGSDLLRLSKNDLVEICGLSDGIRLYNNLHNQPIKPKRVLYVSYENSEVFHPIYLYDVTLTELLKELSKVFRSQLDNSNRAPNDEMKRRSCVEKGTINSSSSCDSRSSMGALSNENGAEEYIQKSHFFDEYDTSRRKMPTSQGHKSPTRPAMQTFGRIKRLLVDGLTPVKIIATEQVVQLLNDESLWELSMTNGTNPNTKEACLTACRSRRNSK